MQAIILSAGQGKRLGKLTEATPKCLLEINDKSILELQLNTLQSCGVERIHVVVGFAAEKVDKMIRRKFSSSLVDTIYNPFYATSENLISCWLATPCMDSDFLLLNGDTLFEQTLLQRVIQSAVHPVTVSIDQKETYDPDDMKIISKDNNILQIGKNIAPEETTGESIGLHLFKKQGAALFKSALDKIVRQDKANQLWYLSVINRLSNIVPVGTCNIQGLNWTEIDYPEDLKLAKFWGKEWNASPTRPNTQLV